jgi:predicted transcriptional regulator
MDNRHKTRSRKLGELEHIVMDHIWRNGETTAESCRESLKDDWPMKDSTARTVLRRLEEKGFLTHEIEGRTFIYRPAEPRHSVAARAVRQIIDRFCGGSVEQLLVGMVDSKVLSRKELEKLARKIALRSGKKS